MMPVFTRLDGISEPDRNTFMAKALPAFMINARKVTATSARCLVDSYVYCVVTLSPLLTVPFGAREPARTARV
jgi:hypothetical protein